MRSQIKAVGILALVGTVIDLIVAIVLFSTNQISSTQFIGAYAGIVLILLITVLVFPIALFVMGIILLANAKPPEAKGLYIATGVLAIISIFFGLFFYLAIFIYVPTAIVAFIGVKKTEVQPHTLSAYHRPPSDIPLWEINAANDSFR